MKFGVRWLIVGWNSFKKKVNEKMRRDGSIERAIELAANTHAGQVDKQGHPYILHPLRVMVAVAWKENRQGVGLPILGPDLDAMKVAVLHDVCEDTDATPEDLRIEGFSVSVVEAVRLLTRPPAEAGVHRPTYVQYIRSIKEASKSVYPNSDMQEAARIALRVKLADLQDNLSRIEGLPEQERSIERRYKRALDILWGMAD